MFTVTLANDKRFETDGTVSLLDAARSAGLVLEHSCRTGRCGLCKAPVVAGETRPTQIEQGLTEADRSNGLVLTCSRAATGDVELGIGDLGRVADVPVRTLPARIAAIERLAPTIVRVTLRLPPNAAFHYLPGQYIDVIAVGAKRSYSIANAPRADGTFDLLIREVAGGALSAYWFDTARPNDLLRFEGPRGTFFRRDDAPGPLVFLATGTGIAPVNALLEELAAGSGDGPTTVYWGNRDPDDFRMPLARSGGLELLLSRNQPDWTGRHGRITDALITDGPDLSGASVYACGSPAMIDAARSVVAALGLPPRRFYCDPFVAS